MTAPRTPTAGAAMAPPPVLPTSEQAFTEQDWEDALYAQAAECADPEPCPHCNRTGFYGPRALGSIKARSCRFCGFFQQVDMAPTRYRPVAHHCPNWPEVAGAPYLWWIPADERFFTCSYCKQKAAVEGGNAFVKSALAKAPTDDPSHPWWKIEQNKDYKFYYDYWESWPVTKGRAVL